MTKYMNPNDAREYTFEQLSELEKDDQMETARAWFLENYENPHNELPYDKEGGGYVYLYGGPYEAIEELSAQFEPAIPFEILSELAQDLNLIANEWSGIDSGERYDEEIAEQILGFGEFLHAFQSAILDIETLLEQEVAGPVQTSYYRLLFANVVTSLETFLCDAFLHTVINDEDHGYLRKFVKTTRDFGQQKIERADAFEFMDQVKDLASTWLVALSWHNLDRIKGLYRNTLGIEFEQGTLDVLRPQVQKRHDIVHRNGRTVEGIEIEVSRDDVLQLKDTVEQFVNLINARLNTELSHGAF